MNKKIMRKLPYLLTLIIMTSSLFAMDNDYVRNFINNLLQAIRTDNVNALASALSKEGVSKLVSMGVNPANIINSSKYPLLRSAVDYGALHVVNYLVSRPDTEVNLQDRNGTTALIDAVDQENNEDIVKALLTAPGINVNAINKQGKTALDIAVSSEQNTIADMLRKAGAVSGKDLK